MKKHRVCPVERAGMLDNKFRRFIHNPLKIIGPYIKEGMTVVDFGCGPGFFTIDMAGLVGDNGKVIAVDLQEGMLEKLKGKIKGSGVDDRIILHKSSSDKIGTDLKADFVLAFYIIHELPDQSAFFKEISEILKPDGGILIVEPPLHVSKRAFRKTVKAAEETGLIPVSEPYVFLSKAKLLKKQIL